MLPPIDALKIAMSFSLGFFAFHTAVFADDTCGAGQIGQVGSISSSSNFMGHDVTFESRVSKNATGTYSYEYCVGNDHKFSILYFKWDDGQSGNHNKGYVVPAQVKKTLKQSIFGPKPTPPVRSIEYGASYRFDNVLRTETIEKSSYVDVNSLFRMAQFSQRIVDVTPLQDILVSPSLLSRYLDELSAMAGSPSLVVYAESNVWVPATKEGLASIQAGDALKATASDFVELVIFSQSTIKSDESREISFSLGAYVNEEKEISFDVFSDINIEANIIDADGISIKYNIGKEISATRHFEIKEELGTVSNEKPVRISNGALRIRLGDFILSDLPFEAILP